MEKESAARRAAEEQLEFLIDSSPAAILTMAADYLILRANQAAHRLLGVTAGELAGKEHPALRPRPGARALAGRDAADFPHRDAMPRQARERQVFLANVFFSTYQTAMGPRLAALVVDASEELREREESSLEQFLAGSRILVGAVSHEVRNVCGAIAVIYENLVRSGALRATRISKPWARWWKRSTRSPRSN